MLNLRLGYHFSLRTDQVSMVVHHSTIGLPRPGKLEHENRIPHTAIDSIDSPSWKMSFAVKNKIWTISDYLKSNFHIGLLIILGLFLVRRRCTTWAHRILIYLNEIDKYVMHFMHTILGNLKDRTVRSSGISRTSGALTVRCSQKKRINPLLLFSIVLRILQLL